VRGLIGILALIVAIFVLIALAANGVFEPYIHVECTDFGKSIGDYCGKVKK
jgi:hypothetical protein